jgi:hypothetical protein
MIDTAAPPSSVAASPAPSQAAGRNAIAFLNLAHSLDHFVMLIFFRLS